MSHLKRAREVFDVELAAVKAVRSHLTKSFDQAVGLIVAALAKRQKIVVLGVGKSGNIGRKIAATFTSTGSPAVLLDTVDAMHGDLGILNDGDILLALSYSGETDELINLLPAIRRFAVQIVAVTAAPRSTLGQHAEVVLNVKVPKEACPFNMAPTASTTASLVMGDALAMAVLEARGFKKSEFAKRHPSGAIGRALLLKVADIMRTGSRNPLAPQTAVVRDALLVMGKAKSGSVSVVNKSGKLAGVGSLWVNDAERGKKDSQGNMFVPIDLLKPIYEDLITVGRAKGPMRPWLGMYTAEAMGRLFVSGTIPDGPSDTAGVEAGDLITGINDESASSLAEMYRLIWSSGEAGAEVVINLRRDGEDIDISVTSQSRYKFMDRRLRH